MGRTKEISRSCGNDRRETGHENPLPEMGQAMRELGVKDADQKLVVLLKGLLA